ncbi:MAG: hypothetical protein N2578_05105 [Bdellovibrionaceae bacterium]|nr:hypothetical protein [Pseudobdellovibrionaceae bacterium]
MQPFTNKKGQGLIEYLILVALIAVGTIGVVRVVGKNISVQFANVARALGTQKTEPLKAENPDESLYSKKDLSNFLRGSSSGANE